MNSQEEVALTERSRFKGTVRYFRPDRAAGLAVIDVPPEVTTALGGLKQLRVQGSLNGLEFHSNTMPAGGGVLALSVNRKLLNDAGLVIGQEAEVEIERVDADG